MIRSFVLGIKGKKQGEKNEFEVFSSMPTPKKSERAKGRIPNPGKMSEDRCNGT